MIIDEPPDTVPYASTNITALSGLHRAPVRVITLAAVDGRHRPANGSARVIPGAHVTLTELSVPGRKTPLRHLRLAAARLARELAPSSLDRLRPGVNGRRRLLVVLTGR